MIVGITGHRPPKIGGYDEFAPLRCALRVEIGLALSFLRPSRVVSGFALGVDQDFAMVASIVGLPVTAAIPCDAQDSRWPHAARSRYRLMLLHASRIVIVTPGPYASWKMSARNRWLVDHCDHLIVVWDGSCGGTKSCRDYAVRVTRPMTHINPKELLV